MKELKIYRLLSFILLPFGIMFGIEDLSFLFSALGNPPLLLSVFLLACIVIYIFSSFIFLYKAILKSTPCKRSLRDLIRVNAIVSIIFCLLCILSCSFFIVLFNDPTLLAAFTKQISTQSKSSFPFNFNDPEFLAAAKRSVAIMLPFSLLLLIHIIISFRMMKRFIHLFQ